MKKLNKKAIHKFLDQQARLHKHMRNNDLSAINTAYCNGVLHMIQYLKEFLLEYYD